MEPILIETANYNYLYHTNPELNHVILVHPLIKIIYNTINKFDITKEQALNSLLQNPTYTTVFTKQEIDYYSNKYLFLEKYGFFDTYNTDELFDTKLNNEQIIQNIANNELLIIETTEDCNLRCEYCGYGKYYANNSPTRDKKYQTFENVKVLLDFLKNKRNDVLNTSILPELHIGFYGGEPLLNVNLIKKTVNYAIAIFDKVKFSMTTNGLLLAKHIEFLIENNFVVLISLDGNEHNNSYRINKNNKNSFADNIKNLNYVYTNYPDYFNTNIRFNSVIHNRNSVSDAYWFIKNNFKTNKVSFAGLNTIDIANEYKDEFKQMYNNVYQSFINSPDSQELTNELFIDSPIINELNNFVEYMSGNYFTNFFQFLTNKMDNILPTGTCSPFERRLFFTVEGKIFICERIGQKFCYGALDDNKIEINVENVVDFYNKVFSTLSPVCKCCYKIFSCSCCLYELVTDKDFKKLSCKYFQNKQQYANYLKENIEILEKQPELYNILMTNVIVK